MWFSTAMLVYQRRSTKSAVWECRSVSGKTQSFWIVDYIVAYIFISGAIHKDSSSRVKPHVRMNGSKHRVHFQRILSILSRWDHSKQGWIYQKLATSHYQIHDLHRLIAEEILLHPRVSLCNCAMRHNERFWDSMLAEWLCETLPRTCAGGIGHSIARI